MKKHLLFYLKIIVTVALFFWLASKIDFAALESLKNSIMLSSLLVASFFVVAQFFVGVVRWRIILLLFNINQPFRTALQIYWIGMFFNACLPTGVAGDALRVRIMRQPNVTISKLVNIVFLERLIGLLVLLWIVAFSILGFKSMLGHIPFLYSFELLIIGGSLGFILLSYLHHLPLPWQRYRIMRWIQQLSLDTHILWRCPFITAFMFIITLMAMAAQVLSVYYLAQGLHLPVSLWDCWILVPPVILAMSLPISIGGWGIREGVMISFFGFIGISTTAAFSLSVLFGILMLIIYLPGGVFWILWRRRDNTSISKKEYTVEKGTLI